MLRCARPRALHRPDEFTAGVFHRFRHNSRSRAKKKRRRSELASKNGSLRKHVGRPIIDKHNHEVKASVLKSDVAEQAALISQRN
jgi:hypothetical protein